MRERYRGKSDRQVEAMLRKSIGTRVRKARSALGLTQEDVAERIGISVEFFARIERGNALLSVQTLLAIAVNLELSIDDMVGFTDNDQARRLIEHYSFQRVEEPAPLKRLFRRIRALPDDFVPLVDQFVQLLDRVRDRAGKKKSARRGAGKKGDPARRRSPRKPRDPRPSGDDP